MKHSDSVLFVCCCLLFTLTAGEPDLLDALIYWISGGGLKPD